MQLDWEIWLDEHISPIIAKWLCDETGWIVKSAYTLELKSLSDQEVYYKAKEAGTVIIISKDTDLAEIISILGSPPKLIYLKIENCDNKALFSFLKENLPKAIRLLLDFDKDIVEINK